MPPTTLGWQPPCFLGHVTLLLAFAGGLAGSLHCLGMCGGLAGIVATASPRGAWRRITLYNTGRIAMLATIGAVAGAAGTVVLHAGPVNVAERVLAVAAGTATILIGLGQLGMMRPRGHSSLGRLQQGLTRALAELLRAPSHWAPLAFGTLNAFLPCHLIYAFAAIAAATGSVASGGLTMLAFGLGTLPAMCLPGIVARLVPPRMAAWGSRGLAAVVVAVGIVTVLRGLATSAHVH